MLLECLDVTRRRPVVVGLNWGGYLLARSKTYEFKLAKFKELIICVERIVLFLALLPAFFCHSPWVNTGRTHRGIVLKLAPLRFFHFLFPLLFHISPCYVKLSCSSEPTVSFDIPSRTALLASRQNVLPYALFGPVRFVIRLRVS
jgi:hypothetical protein